MLNTTALPIVCDLETWYDLPWTNGVQLDTLRQLETLEVRTKNSVYQITVMNPASGDVVVRGGPFFPVYTKARVAGASLAGCFLKVFGIYVGFSIEFALHAETIVTTRVRRIERIGDSAMS
jgi:hypothetical protein